SADDFAVEEVFEFVNYNQKHQGDQGHPGRKGEANADHQAVADQISDHRDQAAKESYADDHDGIREARNHDKNGGEHGVDGRDADLRAHHHGETGVESTEAFRNLLAASQVEIVGHGASFAVEFELRMEEKADGHDATHDEQHEFSGCAAGEIGEAANVLRLAPSGVHGEIFEAVVIGEGQFYAVLASPLNDGGDGFVRDAREGFDGLVDKVTQPVSDARNEDDEQHHSQPFGAAFHEVELREGEVREQRGHKRGGQVQPTSQHQRGGNKEIGDAPRFAHGVLNVTLAVNVTYFQITTTASQRLFRPVVQSPFDNGH